MVFKPGDRIVVILPEPTSWGPGMITFNDDRGIVGKTGTVLSVGHEPQNRYLQAAGLKLARVSIDGSKREGLPEISLRKIEPPKEEQLGSWSEIMNITRWRPQLLHA